MTVSLAAKLQSHCLVSFNARKPQECHEVQQWFWILDRVVLTSNLQFMRAEKRSSRFPLEFSCQTRTWMIRSRSMIFYTSTGTFISIIFQIQMTRSAIFCVSAGPNTCSMPCLQALPQFHTTDCVFSSCICLGCFGLGSQVIPTTLDQCLSLSRLSMLLGKSVTCCCWLTLLFLGMRLDCLTAVLILSVSLMRFCESWAAGLAMSSAIFSMAVIHDHLS